MNARVAGASESEQALDDAVLWLRFLPRWSLATAIMALALPVAFFAGVRILPSDNALGAEYAELLQAVRSPGLYRLSMVFDALGWLMIGGLLITLAGVLHRHAPIAATFTLVCGIGQFTGALGGFMRLNGISDLANQYRNATAVQQQQLLQSYLGLSRVINAHFHAGNLIQGMGFLLAAWSAYSLQGFPRWLALWLLVPALLPLAQFTVIAAGGPFSLPLIVVHVIVGIFGLCIAMAIRLRHPSSMLIAAVAERSP